MQFKWRYAFGIGLAVAAAAASTLVLSLATASAQSGLATTETGSTMSGAPPVTGPVNPLKPYVSSVVINHKHPIAGRAFKGLAVTLRIPRTISSVECDAKLADTLLRAPQRFFVGSLGETVVCRWRIPPHTGGKRLRLSTLQIQGAHGIQIRLTRLSWVVRKR